jgi:large subunit ribosomal protein L15
MAGLVPTIHVLATDQENVDARHKAGHDEEEDEGRTMKLSELADNAGSRKKRMRVGRGIGSGKGKTAGRGGKGQTARSGVRIKGFEGGQMPLHRRLPKRGFNNIFRVEFAEINLDRLQGAIDAKTLDAKSTINAEALVKSGVIRRAKAGVRLLGRGELKAKLDIEVYGASKSAIAAVEKAGGTVKILAPAKDGGAAQKAS